MCDDLSILIVVSFCQMVTFNVVEFGFSSGLKIKISYFFVFLWLRLH